MQVLDIDAKKQILNNYFEKKNELIKKHYAGENALDIVNQLSDLTDETIKAFANLSFPDINKIAIVVLGGYGRRELCFKSDIDIALVYDTDDIKELEAGIESFYYSLLDLKVDLGFSPRNIKTFLDLSKQDLTITTALLQGRFLYGNPEIYERLISKFKKVIKAKKEAYIEATLKSRKVRYQSTGSSIYMMEPHIKEGEGGLRDFHEVYWIAKVLEPDFKDYKSFVEKKYILEEDYKELMNAYEFLLRIRNQMHLLCNKKCDVLVFPLQEEVAKKLGYVKDINDYESIRESVEEMMKLYYLNAKSINSITKRILKILLKKEEYEVFEPIDDLFIKTSSEIDIINEEKFEKDDLNILKAFKYYKKYGLDFSPKLEYLLRKNERKLKNKQLTEEMKNIIRELFSDVSNLPKTLRKMQELYILDDLIPEFGYQRCHFQYDHYHKYTTDAHAIKSVEELENLRQLDSPEKKQMYELYKDIKRKDLLIWAIFLHDIGKGHKQDHSILGSQMAREILERFGYNSADSKVVSELVLHHLDMAHISQRRNLNEPKVIEDFVKIVKNKEVLKMLTVLTWCDANAVAPNVWNDWKNALLWELYYKTLEVFEKGVSAEEIFSLKLREKKDKLKLLLTAEIGEERANYHLDRFSDYYLISVMLDDAIKHILMEEDIIKNNKKFAYSFEEKTGAGFSEVSIVIKDIENPLLIITGILTSLNINILSVYSYTRKDNIVVIDLQISTSLYESIDENKFNQFLNILQKILNNELTLEDIMKKRQKGFRPSIIPPPTFVKIDNESSEIYTIFDVSAEDRIGLLFDIIKVFSDFDIYVHLAKVSTQGTRARDAFYVRSKEKTKINDKELLQNIKENLLQVIKV